MRHRKKGRQLGRQTKHRWALFRSLVTSLLEHERIETTEAKAKEIRGFTDRMITLGKDGSLPARRRALSFLRSKDVVSKLFSDVAGRFKDRPGGYTRMVKTRRRIGDAAELVAIELVARAEAAPTKKSAATPAKTEKSESVPQGTYSSATSHQRYLFRGSVRSSEFTCLGPPAIIVPVIFPPKRGTDTPCGSGWHNGSYWGSASFWEAC